jgi:hypothetical protein
MKQLNCGLLVLWTILVCPGHFAHRVVENMQTRLLSSPIIAFNNIADVTFSVGSGKHTFSNIILHFVF